MTNRELLELLGFYERDGWMCHSSIKVPNGGADDDKIFKCDNGPYGYEGKSTDWIAQAFSTSAFNAGSRWQRTESKRELACQLRDMADKIVGKVVPEDDEEDE